MNIRSLFKVILLMAASVFIAQSVSSAQSSTPASSGSVAVSPNGSPASVHMELASLLVSQDAKGQDVLTPVSERVHPRPGDLLVWQATAVNGLDRSVSNLALTIPVPASTGYVGGSALLRLGNLTVAPLFSLDGQTFAPAPLKRMVSVTRNGVTSRQEVTVPPSEYRAVRWMLPTLSARTEAVAELRTSVR